MLTAFLTIISTRSCGVVTMTTPLNGMLWKTVSGTSPVPGGISMNMMSTSSHTTSVQNCCAAPAMRVPRQMTGSSSCSKSEFIDIIWMPLPETRG